MYNYKCHQHYIPTGGNYEHLRTSCSIEIPQLFSSLMILLFSFEIKRNNKRFSSTTNAK